MKIESLVHKIMNNEKVIFHNKYYNVNWINDSCIFPVFQT
jgi:hypothetical protein